MPRAGPAVDTSWPVSNFISFNTTASVSVSTPATSGPGRLIVLTIQSKTNNGTTAHPFTVSGMSLSWTKVIAKEIDNTCCEIWAAWASTTKSASSITVTATGTGSAQTKTIFIAAYAYSGTPSGASSVLNAIGSTNGYVYDEGAASPKPALKTALSGVLNTSGIVGTMGLNHTGAGITPLSNTTIDKFKYDTTFNCSHAAFTLNAASSGTVTVGSSFEAFNSLAIAAIEILAETGPTLTSCLPSSGPTSGGTSVTLTGTNFVSGATVTFGGSAATSVNVVNSATITCTTPSHAAGLVAVVVTNPDSLSDSENLFTFVAPPTLNDTITPREGPTSGGTLVTLTGTGFQAGALVWFRDWWDGSLISVSSTFISSTTLTCTTPARSPNASEVHVQNPDGQDSGVAWFMYVPPYGRAELLGVVRHRQRRDSPTTLVWIPPPPPPPPNPLWGAQLPQRFLRPRWNPERSTSVVPVGFFSSGPPLEAGWPVFARAQGRLDNRTMIVETPATTGKDRLIYATVAWYSGSTAPGPVTVSGLGLTWTRIVSSASAAPFIQQEAAEIWAAWANEPLDPGLVFVVFSNEGPTYALVTVYARSETAGLGGADDAFGSLATKSDMTGASSTRSVTLSGTVVGGAAVVAVVDGSAGAFSALTNTGFDAVEDTIATIGSGTLLGDSAGGAVTIGMAGTGAFYAIAAAEIVPNEVTTLLPWGFFGPLSYLRRPWNPERTMYAAPAKELPNPPPPDFARALAPDSYMRFAWNPERTSSSHPPHAKAIVLPVAPIHPALPSSFMRPRWNPERSGTFEPEKVDYLAPYAILSGPFVARLNQPFTMYLTVSNPIQGVIYLTDVIPWVDGPAAFGTVMPPGRPRIPNRIDAISAAGLIAVRTGAPVTFAYDCVFFAPGEYHLLATVVLRDGSEIEAQEAIVTVAPLQ